MSYDHSNKPKSATHIVADLYGMNDAKRRANEACFYRKQEDGIWYGFHHDAWHQINMPEVHRYQMIPTQWTGEGLPPVGAVCEVQEQKGLEEGGWSVCKIIAVDGNLAIFKIISGFYPQHIDGLVEHAFRPIRTPEQVAAEERKIALAEMTYNHENDTLTAWAIYLYDTLNYRKAVKP